jgi:hypothetical protein
MTSVWSTVYGDYGLKTQLFEEKYKRGMLHPNIPIRLC